MTSSASATVVVELTPPGRGAVAVVVVAGPDALRSVSNCFVARSGHAIGDVPMGRIVLGHWGGRGGEELIVCRRDEKKIEVHCHGGMAAVEAVISRLLSEGCRRLTWQEWISQSAPDRIQAAASIALADAVTERTAAILLDQLNGALSRAIRQAIANVSAADWSAATEAVDELLRRQEVGLHLTNPWRVVVFGAPNVGKSSLINALAGYGRAIVSPTPGTTRDVVTVQMAIDGWPVQLSDTAGFRETQDQLESAGIKLAASTLSRAELAIFVHDAAQLLDDLSNDEAKLAPSKLAQPMRAIHVLNKIDLISTAQRSQLIQRVTNWQPAIRAVQAVSALTGEGIPDLISTVGRTLAPTTLPAGSAVPFTMRQVDGITAARAAVERRDAMAATDLLHALLTKLS
jgi:tRNA modification GTPase